MTKDKRRVGVGIRGAWWVAGLLAVGGCRTTATPEPEAGAARGAAGGDVSICPGNKHFAHSDLTLKVGCDGLKAGSVNSCAFQQATVIFESVCDKGPVQVSWSEPATLFTNDMSGSLQLQALGDKWKGEVGTQGGSHVLCVNSERCPLPGGPLESKTGSLDVYTTGQVVLPH